MKNQSLLKSFLIILLFFYGLMTYGAEGETPENCNDNLRNKPAYKRKSTLAASRVPVLDLVKDNGFFRVASDEEQQKMSELYINSIIEEKSIPNYEAADQYDIDPELDMSSISGTSHLQLSKKSFIALASTKKPQGKKALEETKKIKTLGYTNGFAKLAVMVSAAGLWSRGGGFVKGLVPYNLKNLLSTSDYRVLIAAEALIGIDIDDIIIIADKIISASHKVKPGQTFEDSFLDHLDSIRDELKIKKQNNIAAAILELQHDFPSIFLGLFQRVKSNPSLSAAQLADELLSQAKNQIKTIVNRARMLQFKSLSPIDLKLANIAVTSLISKSYIPFYLWTSEQTHKSVKEYLHWLKQSNNFEKKIFSNDPNIDAFVKKAIATYFAADDALNETHLFGYQIGFYPLDPETGKVLSQGYPAIGEGAGMAKPYMDETGLTTILKRRGVEDWVFQNIEVISNLSLEYLYYLKAKTNGHSIGVVAIKTEDGYEGGSPVIVKEKGKKYIQLREGYKGPFFNSNTIFAPLTLTPKTFIIFELKSNGTIIRAKNNAGDCTICTDYSTSLIIGKVPYNYENFKFYIEIAHNGPQIIEISQNRYKDAYILFMDMNGDK